MLREPLSGPGQPSFYLSPVVPDTAPFLDPPFLEPCSGVHQSFGRPCHCLAWCWPDGQSQSRAQCRLDGTQKKSARRFVLLACGKSDLYTWTLRRWAMISLPVDVTKISMLIWWFLKTQVIAHMCTYNCSICNDLQMPLVLCAIATWIVWCGLRNRDLLKMMPGLWFDLR